MFSNSFFFQFSVFKNSFQKPKKKKTLFGYSQKAKSKNYFYIPNYDENRKQPKGSFQFSVFKGLKKHRRNNISIALLMQKGTSSNSDVIPKMHFYLKSFFSFHVPKRDLCMHAQISFMPFLKNLLKKKTILVYAPPLPHKSQSCLYLILFLFLILTSRSNTIIYLLFRIYFYPSKTKEVLFVNSKIIQMISFE